MPFSNGDLVLIRDHTTEEALDLAEQLWTKYCIRKGSLSLVSAFIREKIQEYLTAPAGIIGKIETANYSLESGLYYVHADRDYWYPEEYLELVYNV